MSQCPSKAIASKQISIGSSESDEFTWISTDKGREILRHQIKKTESMKRDDKFSPQASIAFGTDEEIEIWVDAYFNPYANTLQNNGPHLIIPWSGLANRYEISHATSFIGDFILLEECWPHGPDGAHVIVVNLSALGCFYGLSAIRINRSAYFMSKMLGAINPACLEMVVYMGRRKSDSREQIRKWQDRSYEIARRLLDPYASLYRESVLGFGELDAFYRPSASDEERAEAVQEHFTRLFS